MADNGTHLCSHFIPVFQIFCYFETRNYGLFHCEEAGGETWRRLEHAVCAQQVQPECGAFSSRCKTALLTAVVARCGAFFASACFALWASDYSLCRLYETLQHCLYK